MRKPAGFAALIEDRITVAIALLLGRRQNMTFAPGSDAEAEIEDLQSRGHLDIDESAHRSSGVRTLYPSQQFEPARGRRRSAKSRGDPRLARVHRRASLLRGKWN